MCHCVVGCVCLRCDICLLGVLFWDVTLVGCVGLNIKDYNFLEWFDSEDEGTNG